WHQLHDSDGAHPALGSLVETRFLVTLGHHQEVVDVVPPRVLPEDVHSLLKLAELRLRGGREGPASTLLVSPQKLVAESCALSVPADEVIHHRLQPGAVLPHHPSDRLGPA